MGLFVLETVVRSLGIHGHLPEFGGRAPVRKSQPSRSGRTVMRIVAGILLCAAIFALALWLAVWLAIRLL
jgi:hypothetical protein